jgi:hypothetical protein
MRDWVVIYWDGRDGERQCTVVTERRGPLARRRVVRGRESECFSHYKLDSNTTVRARRSTSGALG